MRPRIMPVVVLALVAVALLGGAAYGEESVTYSTPGECYTCHGVAGTGAVGKVDFQVEPVDYAKCATCHAAISTAQHWHNPGSFFSRCSTCHNTTLPIVTDSTYRFTSVFLSAEYGTFKTSASLASTPQTLHGAHSGAGWVNSLTFKAGSTADCANCHGAVACSACHGSAVGHTDHSIADYLAVTFTQSTGTGTITAPSTCVNAACHDLSKAATADFVPWCGSCHPARVQEHGYDTIDHVADDSEIEGMACSACHSLDLATAHGDPGGAGASCATCHPMPRKTFAAWDQTCATGGCHTVSSTRPMHADIDASHAVAESNTLCLDCHAGDELASIHVGARDEASGKTSCFVCHTGTAGEPATSDCTVCHFTFDDHYDEAAHTSTTAGCSGDGCHSVTLGLMTVHEERNVAFGCFGCHNSIRVAVQDAIAAGDISCSACHGEISGLGGHRDAHAAVPPLASTGGVPNYSYYTGSAGTAPTRDCVGCHTSNLVDEHMGLYYGGWVVAARLDNTGAAFTCGTCHDKPEGSAVQSAIAAGQSACESCHPVHGPINALHTSTFVDAPEVPCAECHSANLAEEHNGQYTSTAGLTGCDVCHDLYEGLASGAVTGIDTMAAIDTANDTRCSACHAAYHTDSTAHDASGAESLACGSCHAKGQTVIDVAASALHPTCATCHKSTRLGEISGHTAECASCHATEGTDYHAALPAAHTYDAMDASCLSTGCHVAKTLPEEHERFLERTSYDTTCALCHQNADTARIDWSIATASCDSCHTVHGNIAEIHTTTASQGCVDCHETGDALALHVTDTGETDCALCHAAPAGRIDWTTATIECGSCHGVLEPVEDNHYPLASHDATEEAGCNKCHFKDMKAEHFKPNVNVGCVQCHENSVDQFATPWDKTCTACHATKHGEKRVKHASSATACGGTGCHDISDVEAIHRALAGNGCGTCHQGPGVVPTTTDCTTSGCHAGVGTSHHEAHNAAATNPGGCNGCHIMYLDDEHAALGMTCATCHESTVSAVQSAIAAGDTRCRSCHPSMHSAQDYEFNPGQAGGHRVSADLPGMRSSFVVNGSTYTWSLPSASSFLKSGWTSDSIMGCDSCHSYSGATGPHGSTMQVNIDPAYSTNWKTAYLDDGRTLGMNSTTVICAKCHDLNGTGSSMSNKVHDKGDHQGSEDGKCIYCHVQVPHGWGRPRLLGYTSDPAPYAADSYGLTGIALRSYTPFGWDDDYCTARCHDHGSLTNRWPITTGGSTPPSPTTGTVTGVVTSSASGAAISGASVSVGGKVVATASNGSYTVVDVPSGTQTLTVSAAGYTSQSVSVSVTAGTTLTKNVTLVLAQTTPTSSNLARTGVASASSTGSGRNTASKAIDGSMYSYWQSSSAGTQWLSVDLRSTKTLDRVVVSWYSDNYARAYRVETSTDGRNWTSQYSTTSGSHGSNTITLSSVIARHVRVYCTNANKGDYRIGEFEVWGY